MTLEDKIYTYLKKYECSQEQSADLQDLLIMAEAQGRNSFAKSEKFNTLPQKDRVQLILTNISAISNYSTAELTGKSRKQDLAEWRMLFTYIVRKRFYVQFTQIAKLLHRDHSTCIHHYNYVQDMIEIKDFHFMQKYNLVKHLI